MKGNLESLPVEECCKLIHNYLYVNKDGVRKLIDLVTSMDEQKRMEVAQAYQHLYSEEGIIEDIKDKIDNNKYADTLVALFTPRADYCCEMIKKRLKYFISEEDDSIFEMICGSPDWLLEEIKEIYPQKYEINLEDELSDAYTGYVKDDLIILLNNKRRTNTEPDKNACDEMAKELESTPIEEWGSNPKIFEEIFAKPSPQELALIGRIYNEDVGRSILQEIDEKLKGKMKILFKEMFYAVLNPAEIFAEKLHKAMKVQGVDWYHLGRIIVQRFEVDMPIIRQFYTLKYQTNLEDDLDQTTTGYYALILIALVNKSKSNSKED